MNYKFPSATDSLVPSILQVTKHSETERMFRRFPSETGGKYYQTIQAELCRKLLRKSIF